MALTEEQRRRAAFSAGTPIEPTRVAPTSVAPGSVAGSSVGASRPVAPTRVTPDRVAASAPIGGSLPLSQRRGEAAQARQDATTARSQAFVANTAKQVPGAVNAAITVARPAVAALSPAAATADQAPGALSAQGALSALRPGLTAEQRGADVREGIGNVVGGIADTVGGAYRTANAHVDASLRPIARFGKGLLGIESGQSAAVPGVAAVQAAPAAPSRPATPPAAPAGQVAGSPPRRYSAKRPKAPAEVPTPPAAAPTMAGPGAPAPSIEEQMQNPGANTFVSQRQGVRTVGEDGRISGAPLTNGSFNVVPSTAISRPGIGNLGADFAGASQAPAQYQAQVDAAQARNQATRDRIASGGTITAAGEGQFRPGTGAGLNPAERTQLLAAQQAAGAQGRENIAQRDQAAAADAARLAEAQMGEAGADRRQGAQIAFQGQEGAANRAAALVRPSQPITLADGTLAMLDPSTNSLTPVTGAGGVPAKPLDPKSAERGEKLTADLAKDAGDLLVNMVPVGQQATPQQISTARAQAAQLRGLPIARNEETGEQIVNINGQWVTL